MTTRSMLLATAILSLSCLAALEAQISDPFAPPRNTNVGTLAQTLPRVIAPKNAPKTITISPVSEPGERLIVSGQITDGKSPVAGASVYVYHADVRGCYPADCADHGPHTFSARLYGAMRTDAKGNYRYETILPGRYGDGPAHIHYLISTNDPQGWQFEMTFADDPIVIGWRDGTLKTPDYVTNGVVSIRPVTRDASGVLHVTQDIVLRLH